MNLKGLFPHGSNAFFAKNSKTGGSLPASQLEPTTPMALGKTSQGETQIRGRIRVVYRYFSCRPLDTDNLAGATKVCGDTLTAVNLLPNDDPYSISVTWEQVKVRHFSEEKLEIEITK